MRLAVLLPVLSGVLLAFGQFFMKRLAASLPSTGGLLPLLAAVLFSPHLYAFLVINLTATVTYVASLRFQTMTNTFAVVFVSMGAMVLSLDVVVNRVSLSAVNFVGLALGVTAVLLIANR